MGTQKFRCVLEAKPNGENVAIIKRECVGHVQKRLGLRIRKLKAMMKVKKLNDGKVFGGNRQLANLLWFSNQEKYN